MARHRRTTSGVEATLGSAEHGEVRAWRDETCSGDWRLGVKKGGQDVDEGRGGAGRCDVVYIHEVLYKCPRDRLGVTEKADDQRRGIVLFTRKL